MTPFVAGLVTLGVPLAFLGLVLLRRNIPVLVFYFVAIAVGLGYLTTTGAVDDIGQAALEQSGFATDTSGAQPAPAN